MLIFSLGACLFVRIKIMANILTISQEQNPQIGALLNEYGANNVCLEFQNDNDTVNFIQNENFTTVILDDKIENFSILAKKIKNLNVETPIFIILLYDDETFENQNADFTGFIDAFIQKPVNKNILFSTINSISKVQKNIEKCKTDNKELNKSLYQLDVLYNTSSRLSGNLDKKKLYEIMFETLEKTLSYDLCCALLYDKPQNLLMVHSLKQIAPSLKEILKEKIVDYAREVKGAEVDFSAIAVEEHIKPSYDNQFFDVKFLNADTLEAPIKVKDKTFGVLLLYRQKPFSKEDVVCFQSVVHQIANPLRTIILYNEIKNANIELKKLERIKSEFVSIVSHELRTPLTPINNALEIVLTGQTGELTENAKKFINMAKKNVSRLSGIIEDLLDLSRMQTGKFDFKFQKYNIKTSLDLIQKTFEEQAKAKNLEFKVNFAAEGTEIYADAHRIEQILSNLVTNAMKFTPAGGKIEVTSKIVSSNEIDETLLIAPPKKLFGKYVKITVKDTGVGIKEEDIAKIFDKFSQIENSLTRNAGGVGLGLTITKHFVDAHLGGIWVESKESEGSAFNVLLPVESDFWTFETEYNFAQKKHNSTSILSLSANSNPAGLIENLKKENILRPLKESKEFLKEEEGFLYKIFFCDLQKNAFDFMKKRITEFINSPEYKDYGIVLEGAYLNREIGVEEI